MKSHIKICPIVTELFLRKRRINISLIFISQSYFKLSKNHKTKCNTLFFHENFLKKRTSTYNI